jgi:hypothetical protein
MHEKTSRAVLVSAPATGGIYCALRTITSSKEKRLLKNALENKLILISYSTRNVISNSKTRTAPKSTGSNKHNNNATADLPQHTPSPS